MADVLATYFFNPRAGATAMCQAVEATMKGVSLIAYAKSHHELKKALEKWGTV